VIVIAYGGWLIANGEFTVGKLSAYVFYSWMFFGPILEMSDLYNAMLSGASAAERIFLLLDTRPRVRDRRNATALRACNGDITFSRVYFRYGNEGEWILRDINLHASPGTSIALVGATGAGKSSIVNLLARFYEPQRGEVRIDGRPHTELTLESLHAHMGIVPQDNYLFSGTVMDNLRYGRPEATDREIIDVAKSLGAHELIEKFAEGYQTTIKERGGGLSLGERQLICFLRVFVADPRIVILDEATSAVDAHTEAVLQNALRKLVVDRTAVIIAHRLSTIRHADSILVVDQGRIVEAGRHDELIAGGGRYYEMYEEYVR
jgi:ATP-binding cassette subfamily B protein